MRISGKGEGGAYVRGFPNWVRLGSTQPGILTCSTIPGYSNPETKPKPLVMGFQVSTNCGLSEGEPMAEEETEAHDSEEAESTGG